MDQQELIAFVQWHMRCEILRLFSRETCIASSRMLTEILRRIGMRSMPITVESRYFNEPAKNAVLNNQDIDLERDGQFARGVNYDPNGVMKRSGWWGGHLCVLVENEFFCDPSADQFSEPDQGLYVPPLISAFQEGDLERWTDGETVAIPLPGKGLAIYRAHPENTSYTEASDWVDHVEGDPFYESVMDTVMGLIGLYDEFPAQLPELPDAPSMRNMADPRHVAQYKLAVTELGYTDDELNERHEEDEARRLETERRVEAEKLLSRDGKLGVLR